MKLKDKNSGKTKDNKSQKAPKYELERYRQFIREASPYVSIIAGRRLKPEDADKMSDEQISELALLIDSRVADLK